MHQLLAATEEWLKRVLPAPVARAASTTLDHTLPWRRRDLAADRRRRVIDALITRHGPTVQAGPFKGLVLPGEGSWGNLAPMLLGSHEQELHEVIEGVLAARPRRVVNVGSAEGYYAVGFAKRLPKAEIFAFDIDARARRLTSQTAVANGVEHQVHVAAECTQDRLQRLLTSSCVLLIDCEGCELGLLRPARVPLLRAAIVIVELHDFLHPELGSIVLSRFAETHSIRIIWSGERDPFRYAATDHLKRRDRVLAVNELRPMKPRPMRWALMVPNTGGMLVRELEDRLQQWHSSAYRGPVEK